ncbi:uncharacterized protein LOC128604420 isoform X2 [Ictalurus furcatus]|uniref:uncharacterized protein LOC128604420 isoform X2 n=1 Tax=Ictalurus furcatus TaxID=66913 RepID=UPI0023506D12|nr:uncharacterized protein LOC128604420 isoform X2 [Ictalurus furcatus]
METSRVALIALVCVVFSGQKRISGAEVETRVRQGDDVTLYSDCVVKVGFYAVWFRNCSEKDHPRLMISYSDLLHGPFPRHSFVFNVSTNVHDLLIKNVTESDQGVYYCAVTENNITKDKGGVIISTEVFHYGNRWTRLSVLEEATVSPNTPTPCVSEWSVSWKLVLGVCAVCVLLSSLLSSICVYCLCTNTTKEEKADQRRSGKRQSQRSDEVGDEVCYASLDIQNLKKKKKRKRRVQHSDFSTYSEVRTDRQ